MKELKNLLERNGDIIFGALVLLYPLLFFLSKNLELFDCVQIIVGFLFLGILFAINFSIDRLCYSYIKIPKVCPEGLLKGTILVVLSALEGFFFLNNLVSGICENQFITFLILCAFIAVVLVCFAKGNIKVLNVFLAITVTISGINYIADLCDTALESKYTKRITHAFAKDDVFTNLKLKKTPNIYYFYLESYTGKDVFKNELGFDNSEFYKYLNSKGFETKDIYSNYNITVLSLTSTFTMNYRTEIFNDGIRQMTGKNSDNNLFNVLEDNGYELNYHLLSPFYYTDRNCRAKRANFKYTVLTLVNKMFIKQDRLEQLMVDNPKNHDPEYYYSTLKDLIVEANKSEKPQFFFIKGMPFDHFPIFRSYLPPLEQSKISEEEFNKVSYKYFDSWYKRVPERVNTENKYLKETIDFILEKDPNAVIVLLGDHGASKYRSFCWTEDLKETVKESPITAEQYAGSDFSVIYALRYPFKEKFKKTSLSSVNIFRYILAELSENPELIKTIKPSISISSGERAYKIVRNGKVLDDFERAVYKSPLPYERKNINILGIKIRYKARTSDKEIEEKINKMIQEGAFE